MKVANKTDKKEQVMGLKLTFGDYVITSTEPSQYTVTIMLFTEFGNGRTIYSNTRRT